MKPEIKYLFCCLLVVVVVGCQSKGPAFDPYRPMGGAAVAPGKQLPPSAFTTLELTNQIAPEWLAAPTNYYRLGPGDGIEIEVLGEPLTRTMLTVGPDGKIYYSLLPGTFVWGLTLTEAKDVIEQGLAKFIRVKPELELNLINVVSKRVWVLGHVRRPGIYPLGVPMTLLETISMAGGTVLVPGSADEVADLQTSFVMRGGKVLRVNFQKLLHQGDMSQNIYLQPDDFVYMRSGAAKELAVLGAVARPILLDYSEQMTLISALANAGGTLPYAYVSHVVIVRGAMSDPQVATVNYNAIRHGNAADVRLAPGDIVYVPFRPTQKLEALVNSLVNEFVRTLAVNEGTRATVPSASPVTPAVTITGPTPTPAPATP